MVVGGVAIVIHVPENSILSVYIQAFTRNKFAARKY